MWWNWLPWSISNTLGISRTLNLYSVITKFISKALTLFSSIDELGESFHSLRMRGYGCPVFPGCLFIPPYVRFLQTSLPLSTGSGLPLGALTALCSVNLTRILLSPEHCRQSVPTTPGMGLDQRDACWGWHCRTMIEAQAYEVGILQCWLESWLLCFWSSSLNTCPGKQQSVALMCDFLSPIRDTQ